MNAVILPGNSPAHAQWLDDAVAFLNPHFDTIHTRHYPHWKSGQEWARVSDEVSELARQDSLHSPYILIAKSIGAVIALHAVIQGVAHPEKIILLGIPHDLLLQTLGAKDLHKLSVQTVVIQHHADPFGSFEQIAQLFGENSSISCIETPGDTHSYTDFAQILKAAR